MIDRHLVSMETFLTVHGALERGVKEEVEEEENEQKETKEQKEAKDDRYLTAFCDALAEIGTRRRAEITMGNDKNENGLKEEQLFGRLVLQIVSLAIDEGVSRQ